MKFFGEIGWSKHKVASGVQKL